MSGSAPRGVAGRERLPDQLRGLALLGIVLVNAPFLLVGSDGYTAKSVTSMPDRVAAFAVVAFAQAKFYLLFSFLFGYSLVLMLRRADAARVDGSGLRRYRRRLVGLAGLGVAHGVLLFIGDILLSYALLGMVLLWSVRRSDRVALWSAGAALLVGWVVLALVVVSVAATGGAAAGTGVTSGFVAQAAALDDALLGSFADGAAARLEALPGVIAVLTALNWPSVVAMFLLGLVAGRRGILARPLEHRTLWRRLLVVAAVVGVPGGLVSGLLAHGPGAGDGTGGSELRQVVAVAIGFATAPALTGGYVALVALATRSWAARALEPAGRMSLTGYLGESLLLSAVACGWGLGLLGRLGALQAAAVAVAAWLVLEGFARIWSARLGQGPAERVLRAWTYGSARRRTGRRREPGLAAAASGVSDPGAGRTSPTEEHP